MLLEVALIHGKPLIPFKLNPKWLKEEDFIKKLKDFWTAFYNSLNESVAIQFLQNLKKDKQIEIQWSKEKREKVDIII
jgi:hypothetical protein